MQTQIPPVDITPQCIRPSCLQSSESIYWLLMPFCKRKRALRANRSNLSIYLLPRQVTSQHCKPLQHCARSRKRKLSQSQYTGWPRLIGCLGGSLTPQPAARHRGRIPGPTDCSEFFFPLFFSLFLKSDGSHRESKIGQLEVGWRICGGYGPTPVARGYSGAKTPSLAVRPVQVILRKRATNHRALLRKMTDKDKASYGSSPP